MIVKALPSGVANPALLVPNCSGGRNEERDQLNCAAKWIQNDERTLGSPLLDQNRHGPLSHSSSSSVQAPSPMTARNEPEKRSWRTLCSPGEDRARRSLSKLRVGALYGYGRSGSLTRRTESAGGATLAMAVKTVAEVQGKMTVNVVRVGKRGRSFRKALSVPS